MHRLLVDIYGEHAPSNTTRTEWFRRFNNGDFDVSDKECEGASKNLKMHNCKCYSMKIDVECSKSCRREWCKKKEIRCHINWKTFGHVRDASSTTTKEGFLQRIITGDEKWIQYDSPKYQKAWMIPNEPGPSMPRRNIQIRRLCWASCGIKKVLYQYIMSCWNYLKTLLAIVID